MSAILTALTPLAAQSQIAGYDKMLRTRATIRDIYVNMSGLFNRDQESIPNMIYMTVDGKTGANNTTVTMKLPLIGPPITGNRRLSQTEEQPRTKAAKIYRNNYKKAVSVEQYGVRKVDQESYGLYKKHIADLSTWARQYEGLEIRQAILETYGMSLWAGDTINLCQPRWNPHFYVQNATDAAQPVHDPNLVTYTNRIVAAILDASGTFANQSAAAAIMFNTLNKLCLEALARKLFPLMIEGNQAYIFVVSPLQATLFGDPTWNDAVSSGGAVWLRGNQLSEKTQKWHGMIGKFMSSIGPDIYVVRDEKCPTLIPSGTAAPYSLSAGYMWPGDLDRRQLDNPNVRDACFLLGKGAVSKWEPEPLHFVKQGDDYERIMGHGIAGVRGIQQVQFDQDNPNATSLEYYGSMVVVMARPNYPTRVRPSV